MPISGSPVPTLGCSSSLFSLCMNMQFAKLQRTYRSIERNIGWSNKLVMRVCSTALVFSRFQELFLLNSFAKRVHSGCISCQVHCHLLEERVQAAEVWWGLVGMKWDEVG